MVIGRVSRCYLCVSDVTVIACSLLLLLLRATQNVHTTSGIIGIKALFEAMSRLGRADVPVLMSLVTTYPSYGYMMTNEYEPVRRRAPAQSSRLTGRGVTLAM